MTQTMTDGCQCGRVRYTVQADPCEASLCHCKMCRKATGGVAAAFAEVQQADVVWNGEPDWYDPSPFRPKYHFGAESLHEAWIDTSALPRHRAAEYDLLVEKWKAAGRDMPE